MEQHSHQHFYITMNLKLQTRENVHTSHGICVINDFISFSFYSATKDQKASYKSRQNIILYSAYIRTCIYTSHMYTYTHIHTLSQQRCWEHYFKFK